MEVGKQIKKMKRWQQRGQARRVPKQKKKNQRKKERKLSLFSHHTAQCYGPVSGLFKEEIKLKQSKTITCIRI